MRRLLDEPPLVVPQPAVLATVRTVRALTKGLTDEELLDHRRRWLRSVVRGAATAEPYRSRWADGAVAAALSADTPEKAIAHLPVVPRRDLAAYPVEQRRAAPLPPRTFTLTTSGSTGERLEIEYPPGGSWWLGALVHSRPHERRLRPWTRWASLGDDERRTVGGILGWLGVLGQCRITPNSEPEVRAAEVARARPRVVIGPGKMLVAAGRVLWDTGWRPGTWPRAVYTFAELLESDTRQTIHALWGCDPIDHYGATETGSIAAQCRCRDLYHIADESVIVELLDDRDEPAAPPQPGRVTVTALWNRLMPIVRYRLDDMAVAADRPCACGYRGRALASIDGRAMDWIWDGAHGRVPPQRFWLSCHLPATWLRAVRRSRVHQLSDGTVVVEVEASLPADVVEELRRSVSAVLSDRVSVQVRCLDRLTVPPGRWRSVFSDVRARSSS